MKHSLLLSRSLCLGLLTFVGTSVTYAQAITPLFIGTSGAVGNVTYTYQLQLSSQVRISAGDKFTFYDFSGLLVGGANSPSFVGGGGASYLITTPLLGDNPANTTALAGDNPGQPNVSLTYNGTTIQNVTGNNVLLGTLTIHSTNAVVASGEFTAYAASATNNANNAPSGTQGFVSGPNASTTPEPGTWAMFVGMGISGGLFLKRRQSAVR